MTIIAFAGKKQSGKTTSSNFLHGYVMQENLVVDKFSINDYGQLVVSAVFREDDGSFRKDMGVLDLSNKSEEMYEYASRFIWPLIKNYNFADLLKDLLIETLGLTYEQCYGSDADKNTLTDIRWENMPGNVLYASAKWECDYAHGADLDHPHPNVFLHEKGNMTAREVLQYVGTDIFRKIKNNVWIDAVFRQIEEENPTIAVIGDCRFLDEAKAIKDRGGFVIHLTRNSDSLDTHSSENEISKFDGFDLVIDNANLSIEESNAQLLSFLIDKKVLKPNKSINNAV